MHKQSGLTKFSLVVTNIYYYICYIVFKTLYKKMHKYQYTLYRWGERTQAEKRLVCHHSEFKFLVLNFKALHNSVFSSLFT